MLEQFTQVKSQSPLFITLYDRSIVFSKAAVSALNYPPFVKVFVDKKGKRVAFQASQSGSDAFPFYKPPKEGRSMQVKLCDKEIAGLLQGMSGNLGRFYGEEVLDEHAIVFEVA